MVIGDRANNPDKYHHQVWRIIPKHQKQNDNEYLRSNLQKNQSQGDKSQGI